MNKYKVVGSMVRGFFEGFFSGLMDGRGHQPGSRILKQLLAEHYEQVSEYFFQVMFPLLVTMNFDSYEQAVEGMRKRHFSNSTSVKMLLRFACGSKQLFDAMTGEYKRQMECLLGGRFQRQEEHLAGLVTGSDQPDCDEAQAIRWVVRAFMQSYAAGIKAAGTGKASLHQPTVLRMMVSGMATLLHDKPFDEWADAETVGLDGVFRRACRTAQNYEILITEMNQAYADLAANEGIVSADDRAN
ncbi:hypothetical protein [Prevotella sp. kh1p2]|uniref:hypothetical protein n=1 Tax=Prevotella sp. kh1p2 TaxID=1761883 RepID=UPI0008BF697B|nr:hypothetical protein [Prevotella sp. kh1p2]SES93550.1 hypothetical protein SAMN04487825_10899 [Prevotella sp. kh1p2]SNU11238.1 hypothetical protein SAMN06298210_10899 [Prevotellaceae bacterium KH2P17]